MFAEVVPQGVDYINYVVAGLLEVADDVHVVAAMLNIISEIESIADCCMGIGKILNRKIESGVDFNVDYINYVVAGLLEVADDVHVVNAGLVFVVPVVDVAHVGAAQLVAQVVDFAFLVVGTCSMRLKSSTATDKIHNPPPRRTSLRGGAF